MNTSRSVLFASLSLSLAACVASGSGQFGTGGSTTAGASNGNGGAEGAYGGPSTASGGAGSGPAQAGPGEPRWDDFAFAVRERSGTYNAPWVISKFTTFKVSPSCYAKLGDKDSDALNNSSYYTREVLTLAKTWTGDDWEAIENQRSDRARDRALVEPMMNEFTKRFHMTIAVEGDDCDNTREALWIRYWYAIGEAFAAYPPAAGKLDVTLNVTAAARDVSVDVDETGSHFVFTAPRDIEARDWSDKLEKPFRRVAKKL